MWCVLFNRTQTNFITFVNVIHWIVFYSFENTVSINAYKGNSTGRNDSQIGNERELHSNQSRVSWTMNECRRKKETAVPTAVIAWKKTPNKNRHRNKICLLNYATGDLLAIISASSNFIRLHSSHWAQTSDSCLNSIFSSCCFVFVRNFTFCHLRILILRAPCLTESNPKLHQQQQQ